MESGLLEWQEKEFNKFLGEKKDGLVLFSAPWCSACKIIAPIVEEIAVNFKNISFAKIDVSKNPSVSSRMNVMSLPNILFFSEGKVKGQIIGATSKKNVEDKIKTIYK